MKSVSERFREIDMVAMDVLGSKTVDSIMADIHNDDLSLKNVADRNNVNMSDVVQVARYHKIDPVTLAPTD